MENCVDNTHKNKEGSKHGQRRVKHYSTHMAQWHSMQRRQRTEGKNLSDYLTNQDAAAVDRTLISDDDSDSDDEEYINDDESDVKQTP